GPRGLPRALARRACALSRRRLDASAGSGARRPRAHRRGAVSDEASVASSPEPWPAPLPWQRAWLVERLRARDRMHHALLIAGPAGLGKKALALHYAQALLCESPRD